MIKSTSGRSDARMWEPAGMGELSMKVIRAILNGIKTLEKIILIALFIIIVLTTFLQVIGRYTPLPFSGVFEEVATFSFVWATMIGAGTCAREGGHMTMDFLVSYVPKSKKIFFKLFSDIVATVVGCGLIIAATQLIPRVRRAGMLSGSLRLPLWIQNLAVPVAAALIILWSVVNIVTDIQTIAHGESLPEPKTDEIKED
jgi:TRAP-type C4-dicarboxylate transport system permease small subunit